MFGAIALPSPPGAWDKFRLPAASYLPLAYAVFVSSALCYGLLSWANKHMHASVVAALWPVQVKHCVAAGPICPLC
jgi:drug/metabolite transporter (DMT)-like permease